MIGLRQHADGESPEDQPADPMVMATADQDGPLRLSRLLVGLAVKIGRAERREEVLDAVRATLTAGLPAGAESAYSGPADRDSPPSEGDVRLHPEHRQLAVEFPDLAVQLAPAGDGVWLTVPLAVGDDDMGALGLRWPRREAPDEAIREFVGTTARLASLALRSAEERTRDHEVTERFQRSLLPIVAPIPGLEVEYRYQPAGRDALAGGDFYDVIELAPERTAVIIGDVAGHGTGAAAASGEVRYLLRGVLEHTQDPAKVLCMVESALGRGGRPSTMVTVLCAQIDTSTNLLRMASAGHCPPIIRTASGAVHRAIVPPAPPLGAGFVHAGAPPVEVTIPFEPGDVAVLYTDGLIERRATSLDVMSEAVEVVVGEHADPASLCRHLAEFAATDRDHDDDLALLVVRRHAGAPRPPGPAPEDSRRY